MLIVNLSMNFMQLTCHPQLGPRLSFPKRAEAARKSSDARSEALCNIYGIPTQPSQPRPTTLKREKNHDHDM